MTTNATVEARHKDGAAGIALMSPGHLRDWIARHLANLEAANNRLAEIALLLDAEAVKGLSGHAGSLVLRAHNLASGHTPTPCPDCAAKDEAMEAMRADLVEIDELASHPANDWNRHDPGYRTHAVAKRAVKYRIPPAEPLAEALKALIAEHGVEVSDAGFDALLAWHKGELLRLPGGAK